MTTTLAALLAATPAVNVLAPIAGAEVTAVRDIVFDSRRATTDALFCCVRGDHTDGHEHAAAAIARGATALLVDHLLSVDVAQVVVADTRVAMAYLAAAFFGQPSSVLDVVGVTGTNGKTTTTHILRDSLVALGRPTSVIGTLSGTHTTPEAPDLQALLAGFVSAGDSAVAMEVSSHALALDRIVGCHFRVGVFTNLGRDHLDLHVTQERYFAAKARLFDPLLTEQGVVNADDVHGRLLADAAPVPITTFSLDDITDVVVGPFHHEYRWRGQHVHVGLGGRFNVSNSLAAATALVVLGFAPVDIAAAIAATSPVRGRFEPVLAGQDFAVIVDYAHTPDALVEVLAAARGAAAGGRVVVVFGCGGDRDRAKRPAMGAAAAEHADVVVITSDNPRSEDPVAIINDIIAGVPANYRERITVEPDRFDAIAIALRAAARGDVVVIAGKGHETTQTFHDSVAPFEDRAVARELLETML